MCEVRATAVSRAVRAVAMSPGGADHREVLAGCSTPTFLPILPNWEVCKSNRMV